MNTMWLITTVLVLASVCVLLFSFIVTSRIHSEIKSSTIKRRWHFLRYSLLLLVAGNICFWLYMPAGSDIGNLIIAAGLLFIAAYLLVSFRVMVQSIGQIKREDSLEWENITDLLTGIYNRRYLEMRLKEEIARAQRYQTALSLILLNVDNFHRINEKYGRTVGDQLLIKMGQVIKEQIRETDLLARYGGDEMAILLPNTGGGEVLFMAERIRQLIEKTVFTLEAMPDRDINCTVSIGITSLLEDRGSIEYFMRAAESALSHAKQTGRNRVLLYKKYSDDVKTN